MVKKTANVPKIRYEQGDQSMLDQIKVMWEGLNQRMGERSIYFKQHFMSMTFEKRKADLLAKAAQGLMRVDLAVDDATGEAVGYLVSSFTLQTIGTVESIFVCEAYRGIGVGDGLMKSALAWLDQNGAVEKVLEVTVGNEQVYGFYGRYGFLPRQTLLKQVKE